MIKNHTNSHPRPRHDRREATLNPSAKACYHVLIADDSEDDRFVLKTAILRVPRLKISAEVSNGTEVIAYLHGLGPFADRRAFPVPDLLLLDLKMPFKDGFAVLEWLQTQRFQDLTVVVLTDSMEPGHIKRALDMGADHYQVKTRSTADREAMVHAFEEYLRKPSATTSSYSMPGKD